ncbi:MAG: hypothetical protein A2W19_08750 [Spirochaetes bacterium RBG_16_49_21]|nr:MAG: hypothetical protein A2W19_08750 [Spirochaetes bacterium RBG_16_49_21]
MDMIPGIFNRWGVLFVLIFVASLWSCSGGNAADRGFFHKLNKNKYVAGEYIISLAANAGEDAIQQCFSEYGLMIVKPLGNNAFLIKLTHDPGFAEIQKKCSASGGKIKSVQPNYIYRMLKGTF